MENRAPGQPEQNALAASVRILTQESRGASRFTINAATRLPSAFAHTMLR